MFEGEPTNEERAEWAQVAVDAFSAKIGQLEDPDEPDLIISDLLSDLMHLCDQKQIDFGACIDRATMHYEEECPTVE